MHARVAWPVVPHRAVVTVQSRACAEPVLVARPVTPRSKLGQCRLTYTSVVTRAESEALSFLS